MEETGQSDPKRAMVQIAQQLIDEAGFRAPPFDPEILASLQGVREVRYRKMPGAARLIPEPDGLVIEVNEDHSRGKQNFSIDHETSHTALPTYSGGPVEDTVTGTFAAENEEERLCDIGAAALLLDERHLWPRAVELGPSVDALLDLANLFDASIEATARQLTEMDVWPAAIVFWEDGFRKAEIVPEEQLALPALSHVGGPQPKPRVARVYRPKSFGVFIPPNKSAPIASGVERCCLESPRTSGVAALPISGTEAYLYFENRHVPYTAGVELRNRVVSLVSPVTTEGGK